MDIADADTRGNRGDRRSRRARRLRRLGRTSPVLGAAMAVGFLTTSCAPFVALNGVPNCNITPGDSVWRTNVTKQAKNPSSDTWLGNLGLSTGVHPDFGTVWDGAPNGIPYTVVDSTTPRGRITFDLDDSDTNVLYPEPATPNIEGGPNGTGDRHILMVDKDACRLYELWDAWPSASGWTAGSGATWDMTSNAMRTDGATSADAAGLQILPGLVRYEELAAAQQNDTAINHAIRITFPKLQKGYDWPASHNAGATTSTAYPKLGDWLRLKSTVDPMSFDPYIRPIVRALQTYGAIIADNGSAFYISGAPDPRFDDDKLGLLSGLKGNMFEFIDTANPSPIQVATGSYQSSEPN
jgi:hypothetical protein